MASDRAHRKVGHPFDEFEVEDLDKIITATQHPK